MIRREERPVNVDQIAAYLTSAFSKATRPLGFRNTSGTDLYNFQVEFAYILHDITKGPICLVPKHVSEANSLISYIESGRWKEEKTNR